MADLAQREVGWLITKEHAELEGMPSRVGWGQLRVHADETEKSYERVIGRSIFMDRSLTEHMMPEEVRVRWRSFEDDDVPAFDGLVNVHWLFNEDDLGFNVDRFNETDVGAVYVFYSVEDMYARSDVVKNPAWERIIATRAKELPGSDGRWIEVYG
jgi:hypothetical protein